MNSSPKSKLPPNPYQRSPIKKREDLAGRGEELKLIKYYLNLTASGQSPHLALIGQRGVGKTSLLNGAESSARELQLLPVRLNMNEQKAKSPGRFWHDLYQALALSMARAGCWGELQGIIYAELLRMIYSRQPGNLDKAVLQIPYVFSCHQGTLDEFECPDALVVYDFETCLTELREKGYAGIALLIDEADCLGMNVPLLQMFRNIFQTVECCSLLMAGTEYVFPALTEVFSPIPRQFHRIDVKPFTSWVETMQLVSNPLSQDLFDVIGPAGQVIEQLHELCGGAPDEVQLYCHHMYRGVEDGSIVRMSLSPQVFRGVLREYRANSSSNISALVTVIERLPDKLLFESKWLSRRNLSLDENIRIAILRREISNNAVLPSEDQAVLTAEITSGYQSLFEMGITESETSIRLVGAPLTSGFWKSFVKVERGKRWTWDDLSFSRHLQDIVTTAAGTACGGAGQIMLDQQSAAVQALEALRIHKITGGFQEGMSELISTALFARDTKSTHAVDVSFQLNSYAGKQAFDCRILEKPDVELHCNDMQQWLDERTSIFAKNDVDVKIINWHRWPLPSAEELHDLGYISGAYIPRVFGPSQATQAIAKFDQGDIMGCIHIFERLLVLKEKADIRNNLAFCQMLMGEFESASKNAAQAAANNYEPLYGLNKGLGEYFNGNVEAAKATLKNALNQAQMPDSNFSVDAMYVLVIDSSLVKVNYYADVPLNAAIAINLYRVGEFDKELLKSELNKTDENKCEGWIEFFVDQQTIVPS